MNRLKITSVCVAGMLGVSACAAPQHRADSAQMSGNAAVAVDAEGVNREADRFCLRHTGSRIIARDNRSDKGQDFDKRCVAANGRVYTREDIDRTGQVDLADALRMLDPSIH